MKRFELSGVQTKAILDMRLARLTGLEREKILSEIAELERRVAELMAILSDRAKLMGVILEELREIRGSYADERRTEISPREGELIEEDLIAEEDMVVAVSHLGYIKRNPVTLYKLSRQEYANTMVDLIGVQYDIDDPSGFTDDDNSVFEADIDRLEAGAYL